EPDIHVQAQASDAEAAMQALREHRMDVAIVDLSLPGVSGIELIRQMQSAFPDLPIVVFSMHDEQFYAERALRAGARGYVMKQEDSRRIIAAVRKVRKGELFVSDDIAKKMLFRMVTGDRERV